MKIESMLRPYSEHRCEPPMTLGICEQTEYPAAVAAGLQNEILEAARKTFDACFSLMALTAENPPMWVKEAARGPIVPTHFTFCGGESYGDSGIDIPASVTTVTGEVDIWVCFTPPALRIGTPGENNDMVEIAISHRGTGEEFEHLLDTCPMALRREFSGGSPNQDPGTLFSRLISNGQALGRFSKDIVFVDPARGRTGINDKVLLEPLGWQLYSAEDWRDQFWDWQQVSAPLSDGWQARFVDLTRHTYGIPLEEEMCDEGVLYHALRAAAFTREQAVEVVANQVFLDISYPKKTQDMALVETLRAALTEPGSPDPVLGLQSVKRLTGAANDLTVAPGVSSDLWQSITPIFNARKLVARAKAIVDKPYRSPGQNSL